MNALARAYELGYLIYNYDYAGLDDPEMVVDFSSERKVLCRREHYSDLAAFLAGGELLSKRGETTTEKVRVGEKTVIVKKEKRAPGLFRLRRGAEIWNHALVAKKKKIPALTPLAMVETKEESAVIYLLEGTDLKRFLKKEEITGVAKLVKALRLGRAIHHDFRLKNVVQLDNHQLKLIDLDKFHIYPALSYLFHYRLQREMEKFKWDWERKTPLPLKFFQEGRGLWKTAMLTLARLYEAAFSIFHYDYRALDGNYVKELGFKEKLLAEKEYYRDAKDAFAAGGAILHKRGSRKTMQIGEKYILKTERAKGFFKNLFFQTRGVTIWNNAEMAKSLGFPVLKPVAMLEKRGLFEVESSVLYLKEGSIGGDMDIRNLVEAMQELRLMHHDLRPKNLVKLADETLQCIDIDHMHRYPKYSYVFGERLRDEIKKFHYQQAMR